MTRRRKFSVILTNGVVIRLKADECTCRRNNSSGALVSFEFTRPDRWFSVRNIDDVAMIVRGWSRSVKR